MPAEIAFKILGGHVIRFSPFLLSGNPK